MLDFASLDSWRAERTGFPEAIFGPGKSPEQIAAIMQRMAENDQVGSEVSTPYGQTPLAFSGAVLKQTRCFADSDGYPHHT